ncbi:uncharacterized protein LOC133204592 [Saccostrea echinata]|uniref:uncharacterized protein LOC133204592 n=1 Tax=Saccostrea echinata TaxID=191078 RepID=UPI002A8248E0|nr:uncharacterized protein LOC133204592 [Saccostrea echinata]
MVIPGTNLFHNCTFVLEFDSLTRFKVKQCWRRKITENGGTVSYVFTRKTNYVVLFGDMLEKSSYKQRQAVRHNVPVVRCEFITDSIEQHEILSTVKYEVGEPLTGKNFRKGRISKLQKAKTYLDLKRRKAVNLNALKSWSLDDPEAPSANDDKYEVAKWALLKSLKMVHVIEVHALTSSEKSEKFRLYHQGGQLDGEHIQAREGPVVWYLDTADEVLICFEQLYKRYTSGLMNMEPWHTPKFISNQIGSHKLKMILDDICSMHNDLDPDLGQFVEMIWNEAIQEAEKMLTISMQHTKIDKVDDAMAILKQIKQIMKENKSDNRLPELVEEFYREALPHKQHYITQDLSPKMISEKLDLCQLIYDVLTVSEATDFSPAASTVAKYRALRCHMTKLNQSSVQFQDIRNIFSNREQSITIHHVFEVGRTLEDILYQEMSGLIGNSQLLMHASGPQNLLGILSRGLLLPQAVEEEHGITRTDGGKLGYGIYFSNSFETCLHYAEPSHGTGMRMLIVCDVALGNCCDCTTLQPDLTAPPTGYHSCHGVKMTEENITDFMDDEFVIYNTSQQRVRYVILFTVPSDPPICSIPTKPEEEENMAVTSSSVDITDLKNLPDPLSKVTGGLIGSKKSIQIPLRGVHIRAKVIDMVAKVVVLQTYKNNMTEPIEAKYVFPLDETAAVCGFEAFINGKHIIGEIKEKKTAHREYREAISKGHGAYLMDEEEPDIFTVSVGNLPPKSEVLIKVTYITELKVEGDSIALTIPATVAPWVKESALAQQTQSESTVLHISDPMDCQISLQAAIEMPFEIRSLKSSTHRLKYKKTATKAVVEIPKKCEFTAGFQLLITLAEIHVPRMWVECHPKKDLRACMLAFYPEFEAAIDPSPEIIFLLDLSNSMKGDPFRDARKVILLALNSLPEKASFNIVAFGSFFKELFQFPHKITKNSTDEAVKYLEAANPVMGCSDVLSPLKSFFLLSPAEGSRSIFLISDGFVGNKGAVFRAVATNSTKNRLFCLGVGNNRDSHTLRSLANHGGGTYEYYNSKTKSKWQAKIASQIEQATRPGISHVKVEWGTSTNKQDPPLQAPCRIPSLFSGSRQVVYGFVTNCTQAKLMANVDGQEFETMVSTTELNFTEGKMLHQLAARAVIRDYEDGVLSDHKVDQKMIKQERKQDIIELSKEFGIVTPYTSFIAVEERSKGEVTKGPSIQELLNMESVDILTYMGWMNPDDMDDKDPVQCVEELLRKAIIAESFSQIEAERCYLSVLDYRTDLMDEENRDLAEKVLEATDKFFSSQDSESARKIQYQFHKSLPVPKPLIVKTLTGRSIQVTAGSVAELKSEIMNKEGLPEDCIRLIYNGKQLQNTDYLGMPANSTIFLVLRLRGGPPQFISSASVPEIPQIAAAGMELESFRYQNTHMDMAVEDGVMSMSSIKQSLDGDPCREEDEGEDSNMDIAETSEDSNVDIVETSEEEKDKTEKPAKEKSSKEVSEDEEEKKDNGKKLGFKTKPLMYSKRKSLSIIDQYIEKEEDSSEEDRDLVKELDKIFLSTKVSGKFQKKDKGRGLGIHTKPLIYPRLKRFNFEDDEITDSDVTSEESEEEEDEGEMVSKPLMFTKGGRTTVQKEKEKRSGLKTRGKGIKCDNIEKNEDGKQKTTFTEQLAEDEHALMEIRMESHQSKGVNMPLEDIFSLLDKEENPKKAEELVCQTENTATNQYLMNLDESTAYYDPKSRFMKAEISRNQNESDKIEKHVMMDNPKVSLEILDDLKVDVCTDFNPNLKAPELFEQQNKGWLSILEEPGKVYCQKDMFADVPIPESCAPAGIAIPMFNTFGQNPPPFSATSPADYQFSTVHSPTSPTYGALSPSYGSHEPAYSELPPVYSPTSPAYSPASPAYAPISPAWSQYIPTLPTFSATTPACIQNSSALLPNIVVNSQSLQLPRLSSRKRAGKTVSTPFFDKSVENDDPAANEASILNKAINDSENSDRGSNLERSPKSRGKVINSDRGSSLERRPKSRGKVINTGRDRPKIYQSRNERLKGYQDRSRSRERPISTKLHRSRGRKSKRFYSRSRDRSLERDQDKSRGRRSDRSLERYQDISRDGRSERSYSRSRDRRSERSSSRSRDRRSERSSSRSRDRRSERSYSRSRDRRSERSSSRSRDRRSERSSSRSRDRRLERSYSRRRDRRSERSYSRSRDRRSERSSSRSRDRRSERSSSRSRDRRSERSYSRRRDRRSERSSSRSRDRSLERYKDRRRSYSRSRDRRSKRSYSQSRDRGSERFYCRSRDRRSERSFSRSRDRRSERSFSRSRDRRSERSSSRSRDRRSERSSSRSRERRSERSFSRSRDRSLERYHSNRDSSTERSSSRSRESSSERYLVWRDRSLGKYDKSREKGFKESRSINRDKSSKRKDRSCKRKESRDRVLWRLENGDRDGRKRDEFLDKDEREGRDRNGDEGFDTSKYDHKETNITEERWKTLEIQLAEEELQQSICSYPNQFEGYARSKQREDYFKKGSLFCLQGTGSIEKQTCFFVELWTRLKDKKKLISIEWPDTLYMNFVPEYLLNMSGLQPLVEDSVTASVYPSKARPSLSKLDVALTSGLMGCIEARHRTGEFALLLIVKTYPHRPVSLLIPADCEAVATQLQSLVRQHKAKVADHCNKKKEMAASDEPYINMWKGLKESPIEMDLDKLPSLNEAGLWNLDVLKAVGVDQFKLEQLLKKQGLLSLPKSVQDEGLPIFCTFLVGIFWFMHEFKQRRLPKWLCKCENIMEISLDASSVLVQLQCMDDPVGIQFDFPPEAYIHLQNIKSKWTPYIRQLELGKNLTHLVDCLLQASYEYM